MNESKTTLHTLTAAQTLELKQIWEGQKAKLKPDDFIFIKVKLGRPQAKLTINQLYRMTMTLAEAGYEEIPEWLLSMLDPE
ncbi:hypothetical protein [Polynucleobacter sp. KF022]|uniref:hypothetical protein n=1 Tax=Polynucleobacter sp. KF022 TaxID=2982615 RepID=UPI002377595E|nr:hypothetical protein [Polynucleobacter sp. KF022]BDT74875.1 hypothetical protein PKF022_05400 [Polynucleobacter sp. KF022]